MTQTTNPFPFMDPLGLWTRLADAQTAALRQNMQMMNVAVGLQRDFWANLPGAFRLPAGLSGPAWEMGDAAAAPEATPAAEPEPEMETVANPLAENKPGMSVSTNVTTRPVAKPAVVAPIVAETAPAKSTVAKTVPAKPTVIETAPTKTPDAIVPPAAQVAASHASARPAALAAPRAGKADDLKRIKGIGQKLEDQCHALGFFHFDQIAAWTAAEVAWVDDNLEGFKGRVIRDDWVAQAKLLASGGETAFSKRVDTGDVY